MKQKLLAMTLALLLALSLAACGQQTPAAGSEPETPEISADAGDGAETGPEDAESAPDGADIAETDPLDPASGEEQSQAAQEETTQTPEKKPVQKPADKPVQKPVEKPADTQPAPETPASVDLAAFYDTLSAGDADFPGMTEIQGESLEAFYPGLTAVSKQSGVHMATISAAVGEIALAEAATDADVKTIQDIFQSRINDQVGTDDAPGGAWYPASIEGWKNDSRIVTNGRYVMLIVYSGADAVVNQFNALFA